MKEPRWTTPDPTPEEIRERCLSIQATWDHATERSRRGLSHDIDDRYTIPRVAVGEVGELLP